MTSVDLGHVPVVDNHCHGLLSRQPEGLAAWRECFTESRHPALRREYAATTLHYHRVVREMAVVLECEAREDSVLAARAAYPPQALCQELLRRAGLGALLVDTGYPPRDLVIPNADLAGLAGCPVFPMLRVELLMQDLIATYATLGGVIEALRAALADVRGQGYVALKSVVAYRTGLAVRRWPASDVDQAFRAARAEAATGGLRLAHQPLLDTLLHVVFAEAARQEVPLQLHVGYGDTDANMLLANPLHLREVLEDDAYRSMPIVLLHECYPYTREGAYLAAVYDNVYLDLSYGIPFLGAGEMSAFTRAAFGVAPMAKLLYSSDGVGIPELHWVSALQGRRIIGEVLGEIVDQGDLSLEEAEAAGTAVLHDNAVRLYRLAPLLATHPQSITSPPFGPSV